MHSSLTTNCATTATLLPSLPIIHLNAFLLPFSTPSTPAPYSPTCHCVQFQRTSRHGAPGEGTGSWGAEGQTQAPQTVWVFGRWQKGKGHRHAQLQAALCCEVTTDQRCGGCTPRPMHTHTHSTHKHNTHPQHPQHTHNTPTTHPQHTQHTHNIPTTHTTHSQHTQHAPTPCRHSSRLRE